MNLCNGQVYKDIKKNYDISVRYQCWWQSMFDVGFKYNVFCQTHWTVGFYPAIKFPSCRFKIHVILYFSVLFTG
jgi:hypothetical protein